MTTSSDESRLIDDARRWIASSCAALLNEGICKVRVRIIEPKGNATHALIDKHIDNQWVPTTYSVDGNRLTLAVLAVGRMLASHPPTETWQVRSRFADDFEDIELQFKHDAVESHSGDNMLSWVTGALFKDTHASDQDRRRATSRGAYRRGVD